MQYQSPSQRRGGKLIRIPARKLGRAGFEALPATIADTGEHASRRFIEFFTANIRNKNTRQAYGRAVREFLTATRSCRFEGETTSHGDNIDHWDEHGYRTCGGGRIGSRRARGCRHHARPGSFASASRAGR